MEDQLRRAERMQAAGRLAGGMAHEVNNMMTGVIGFSEFLLRSFPEDDARRGEVQEIIRAGTRASDVTRQLLAFTRQQLLHPEVLDMNGVVTAGSRRCCAAPWARATCWSSELASDAGDIRADRGPAGAGAHQPDPQRPRRHVRHGRVTVATGRATFDEVYAQAHGGIGIPPGEYVLPLRHRYRERDGAARSRLGSSSRSSPPSRSARAPGSASPPSTAS